MKAEFDDAGIPWRSLGERMEHLETAVREVRRRLAEGVVPQPVQQHLPLAVGAMSTRGLALAADYADIVSFSGLRQLKDGPPGAFTVATSDQTDELVGYVDRRRRGRPYEADMLLQAVQIDVDPHQSCDRARERGSGPRARARARIPIRAARSGRPGGRGGATAPQRALGVLEHRRVLDALHAVRDAMRDGGRGTPNP